MRGVSPIYSRAEIYDAVYRGRGRDYRADSARLTALVRERNPAASSLLDVACGTGANLAHFAADFPDVAGVDLAPDMLRVARERLPGALLHEGDMRSFELGRRFDAVTCLFSSIGYVDDLAQLTAALERCVAHLNPGGVMLIEPWHFTENALSGHVTGDTVAVDGRTISRMSHTVREGDGHRMTVHYLVADAASGIDHFTDLHMLALFSRAEYERAFTDAGAARLEFLDTGPGRPGLFVAVRP
ncbi:class I SAM-dependent methyltransferase [Actinomadura flavalba]|uniref:class I SAM-dependent methyltransferase n=1 Tax=Actinomadura flavalba TaxID=1120938 RepID=UPI000375DC7C|nr:class I SAM-dependent methyltransferase [Actinomadura flavalba]